jgi:DNA-binding HxlR family transcriptional regulator
MPLQTTYDDPACSVASALDVVGTRWTLLVIRELFLGVHRFGEMQADLGLARNILQDRLQRLTDAGIVQRRLYQERPPRHDYHLTERGLELWPALVSLMQWGDRYMFDGEGAVILEHRDCGGAVDTHLCCERCGARLGPRDVWARAGERAPDDHPLRRRPPAGPGPGHRPRPPVSPPLHVKDPP